MTLADLLVDHPFADSDGLLHTSARTVTAGAARTAARELAARLAAAGVGPGHAVAVRLPNSPESVVAMTAIWLAGAVFVPINSGAPAAEADHAVQTTEAAALIEDGLALTRLPHEKQYAAGTAFVTWTSGTTGTPKAILHTHDGYLELLDRVLGPLRGKFSGEPPKSPSPNLIPVSMALNSGIYNALFGLRAGAPLVIMDRFRPDEFAQLVRRFGIRSTVLPPAAITMLNDADLPDLGPLRYVRSITAPLSPLQARRFTSTYGAFVLNSYGQAEIGEVIGWTAADAKAHPEKVGAAGRPLPGVTIRVAAPDGQVGPLSVRPPRMAAGYAGGGELADRVDADGFVDTGDLARQDAEGFVWIEGRAGDLINRGGNKVFPDQVEEVLRLSPAVADAAVVGAPDDRLGQVPVAFVVDAGVPATDADLEGLCREHLVAYKVPVAFHRLPELPRTEVGKLRRKDLAARLGG